MRMCDLNTGTTRLMRAAKFLREEWAHVKEHWDDGTSQKFEKTILDPIGPEIQLIVASIHRLAEALEDAEQDCEENRDVGL